MAFICYIKIISIINREIKEAVAVLFSREREFSCMERHTDLFWVTVTCAIISLCSLRSHGGCVCVCVCQNKRVPCLHVRLRWRWSFEWPDRKTSQICRNVWEEFWDVPRNTQIYPELSCKCLHNLSTKHYSLTLLWNKFPFHLTSQYVLDTNVFYQTWAEHTHTHTDG